LAQVRQSFMAVVQKAQM